MSIETMTLVLNHSKAKPEQKLILLGIANHQGDQGAWPSLATLARYGNCSIRTVQRYIRELVELGELVVLEQAAPTDSQYKTNLYWVTVSGVTKTDSGVTKTDSGVTNEVSGVTESAVRGDKNGISGVTPSGIQTLIKKPNNLYSDDWKPTDQQRTELQAKYPNANLDQYLQEMMLWIVENGQQKKIKSMSAKFSRWMINADKYAKGELSKTEAKEERPIKWG